MNIRRKKINLKKIYICLTALILVSLPFVSTLVFNNVKAQTSGDLALNKPIVSVSSTAAGSNPAFANDGNPTTYWTSAGGGSQWISIDLGASAYVGQVVIKWGTDTATNYEIDFSDDGVDYFPVWTGINGDFNSTVGRTGRYVRVMVTVGSNQSQYQLGILEIYKGTVPTAPSPVSSVSPSGSSTSTSVPTPTPTPTPSPTPTSTPARISGKASLKDLSIMMSNYKKAKNIPQEVDLNGDGTIDQSDYDQMVQLLIKSKVAHSKK